MSSSAGLAITRTCGPRGAQMWGSVGPNNATTGEFVKVGDAYGVWQRFFGTGAPDDRHVGLDESGQLLVPAEQPAFLRAAGKRVDDSEPAVTARALDVGNRRTGKCPNLSRKE